MVKFGFDHLRYRVTALLRADCVPMGSPTGTRIVGIPQKTW
jgi:hypothetical protein